MVNTGHRKYCLLIIPLVCVSELWAPPPPVKWTSHRSIIILALTTESILFDRNTRHRTSLLRRGFCWLWLRLVLRYISLHFPWRILEHEWSRWAKKRRRERASSNREMLINRIGNALIRNGNKVQKVYYYKKRIL